MGIEERKLLSADYQNKDVSSAPDRLTGTAAQNKEIFDRAVKTVVQPKYNALIDDLLGEEGASNIGVAAGGTLQDFLNRRDNPHEVSKEQVGLGNVDNTSDEEKPVSAAVRAALDQKVDQEAGKGLSSNDYSDQDKGEVEKIKEKADKTYTDEQLALKAEKSETYSKGEVDAALALKAGVSSVLLKDNTEAFTPTGEYQPATKKYVDDTALAAGTVVSVFGRAGAVIAQSGDYTPQMVGAASSEEFTAHAADTAVHVTLEEKEKWNEGGAKRGYTVVLAKSGWIVNPTGQAALAGMYVNPIEVEGVAFTASQQVELTVPPSVMREIPSGISTANVNGTVYAVTEWPPESDLTVQITVENVVLGGES